jgi:dipeptidyl aminopeptidase/acylaminoacyl peptidase
MNNATIEFRTRRACSTRIAWSIAVILVAAAAVAVVPFCGTIFAAPPANAQTQASKHAVTVDDLLAMHRLSDPQISPDGKWVAYSVATPDVPANRTAKTIWLVGIDGGTPRQLTAAGERPRWSPDGSKIAFLSSAAGASQVAWISLDASGSEPHPLTSLPAGADNELWSPDGNSIAFVSNVYPDCADQACDVQRDAEKANSKIHPRVYDRLMFRHWTAWWDGKRSHLFVIPATGGAPKDLTPGADYDVPPFTLGGPEAIAFSPNGKEICFTANSDREQATSTNGDLFTVPSDGSSAPAAITTNPGNDWGPVYSPDGKYIAYLAQMQPGYESDRWRLMLYSRAGRKHINLTERLDRSIGSFLWTPDSRNIYFQSEEHAEIPVFEISAEPSAATSAPAVKTILKDAAYSDLKMSPNGQTLVFTRSTLAAPAGLFASDANGRNVREIAQPNAPLLSQLDLAPAEPFWFAGAGKTQVEGLLLRPPNFDAHKKYPMLLLIHGGPQGAWEDAWSYRWNPEAMAAPGYVVVMINPRGSTGYGSRFTEEISHDWGGKVYTDLMNGVDAAIAKYPFIDGSRLAAAGGSFGGFMIDWIATHSGRFKCLISHAGPYDARSMYATEELWFQEWEYGGTPWEHPELYDKWSSEKFAGALGKFKTPTLVIGGELDFRIPYTQELEFFTALQRQGVPSKLVIFPDEGHWVLKPQNSQFWYHTFQEWLAAYLK